MPGLRELQSSFMDALRGAPTHTLDGVIRGEGLGVERRLAIYRNNLRAGLTRSLEATYPAVLALVGADFFGMLARRHMQDYPSRCGDLHRFGNEFCVTIENASEAARLPYLADVARLEWAYHEVFHAAEREPIAAPALAAVDPARQADLVLELHPASALLASPWPVVDIWRLAIHHDGVQSLEIGGGGQRVLVARRGLEMEFQQLDPAEYAFVEALIGGQCLTAAFEKAVAQDSGFELAGCLARQFDLGNIVGYI